MAKFSHETLGNNLSKKQMETVAYISSFVHPNETILKDFPDWSGDVMNINSSLENLNELEDLYKTIRNQRLVEHKRRFREYMDKSMLDALTNFRAWLSNEEDRIKEIIEELNLPLKKITAKKLKHDIFRSESSSSSQYILWGQQFGGNRRRGKGPT